MMPTDSRRLFTASMTKLQRLEAKHYPEQGRFRELYFEVADCLRIYLNAQYGLDMKDRSTQELERVLHRLHGPSALIQGLRELFAENERVQFARWLPSNRDARGVPERARRLLTMMAPHSVQQQTPQSAGSTKEQQAANSDHSWIMPTPTSQQGTRAS